MKKVLLVTGSVFGLLVLAALIVPFVIDVNKYRPVVEQKVNEKINGKLSLGKVSLGLWGQIIFNVDGLKLEDAKGQTLVQVKDAGLKLPLLSVLSGSPVLNVVLDHPEINVVKGRDGKLNLLSLVKAKSDAAAAPQAGAQGGAAAAKPGEGQTLPAIVLRSRLTFLIEHAKLAYKDELASANYNVSDFSFHLRDVSPSSEIPFDAEAILDLKLGLVTTVRGPLKLDGSMQASGTGANLLDKLDGNVALILDDLDIENGASFHKKKGVTLRFETQFTMADDTVTVPALVFKIADVAIDGKATAKTVGGVTTLDAEMHSNRIDVSKLGALAPAVSDNGLNGIIELSAKANGPSDHLAYSANLKFNDVNLKTESLLKPVTLNGALEVATDELKSMSVKFASDGLDGNLTGALTHFSHPTFRFAMNAKEIDMDKLFPGKAAAVAKGDGAPAPGGDAPSRGAPAGEADNNAMFKPLHQNPMLAQMAGTFDFNIQTLKSSGVTIKNMKGQLALNNLLMQLKGLTFNVFDGAFKTDASINAKTTIPDVGMNLEINGLNTQRMVESQMTFAKNTMKGIISAKMNIGGHGLNRSEINSGWKGGGQFSMHDVQFSTLDVGRQIKTGLIEKLPEVVRAKAKVNDNLLDWRGEYATLDAKFALQSGTLNLTDLTGKAKPNKGLDLKGNGRISIVDYTLDMIADFIDRYQMLGPSIPKDQRYGVGAITAHITGSMMSPHFDWGRTAEQLAKNAVREQVQGKGKEAVKQQLEKLQVPDAAKNLLKGFFH